ncbi:STAS domain-containing protein [Gorillibacterium massiliense]|uniref:STAS domain-containing protein n=1 Tax=Gorillibacterium massiliense TaxID=1280390 RepID=UPI0004AD4965|nr:STAS domain-containing protein [Gorillibacterium massiliense]
MNMEKKFAITKKVTVQRITIYLHGELDLSVAPEMRADLEPYINQGDRELVLNLEGLTYIDSTGIGIIILILKQRDSIHATFRVEDIPPSINRLFELTGITQYLVTDNMESKQERNGEII